MSENTSLIKKLPEAQETIVDGARVETSAGSPQAAATETAEAREGPGVGTFEVLTYASSVTAFILAGFLGVVLLRKVRLMGPTRHKTAAKTLAGIFAFIALHGFFTSFLYNNYVRGIGDVPLLVHLGLWVFAGPALAVVLSNLFTRFETPVRSNMLINQSFFLGIFLLVWVGASGLLSANAALIVCLGAIFLYIVPVVRYLKNFQMARTRHREFSEDGVRLCVFFLLFGPAIVPLLLLAELFGLSPEVVFFLLNLLVIDIVLFGGLGLLILAREDLSVVSGEITEAEVDHPATTSAPVEGNRKGRPGTSPSNADRAESQKTTGHPAASEDPIIQFLKENPEETKSKRSAAKKKEAPESPKKKIPPPPKPGVERRGPSKAPPPPKKPGSPLPRAPKEPGKSQGKQAKNAPGDIRAPNKPKKRI